MSNYDDKNQKDSVNNYQEDLVQAIRIVYKRGLLIIGGVIVFTFVSILISFLIPKIYTSQGFFQLTDPGKISASSIYTKFSESLESSKLLAYSQLKDLGILKLDKDFDFLSEREKRENNAIFMVKIQDFKRYFQTITNYNEFFFFINRNKCLTEDEFNCFSKKIRRSNDLSDLIEEVYALSKDDIKKLVKNLEMEQNFIIGLNIKIKTNSPKTAVKFLNVLGNFVKFNIIFEKFYDYISVSFNEFGVLTEQFDSYIIRNKILLNQLYDKRIKLSLLYKKYPEFTRIEKREVVSLEENGQRYLSIIAQIVGVESRIIDLDKLIASLEIEKKKTQIYYGFFEKAQKILAEKGYNGEVLFKKYASVLEDFFKGKDLKRNEVREVYNSLKIDFKEFKTLYFETMRFISAPTLSEKAVISKAVIVIFGFFVGILFFIFFAFILEFWEKNKKFIKK